MNDSIGIIGLGVMGQQLARGFALSNAAQPENIYIFDRHPEKVEGAAEGFPQMHKCTSAADVASSARYLLISVDPVGIPVLIAQLLPYLRKDVNLFLTSSNVTHAVISRVFPGKVTTFLPTVNCAVKRGVIYACHNEKVTDAEKVVFNELLGAVCKRVKQVREEDYAVLNSISGCMPAFLAYFAKTLADSAAAFTSAASCDELEDIALECMIGTGLLLEKQGLSFQQLIHKVGHPGGITMTALGALEEALPPAADELIKRSAARHDRANEDVCRTAETLLLGENKKV